MARPTANEACAERRACKVSGWRFLGPEAVVAVGGLVPSTTPHGPILRFRV